MSKEEIKEVSVKSPADKKFIDIHAPVKSEYLDHPHANDSQFKATNSKDKSRKADKNKEDEEAEYKKNNNGDGLPVPEDGYPNPAKKRHGKMWLAVEAAKINEKFGNDLKDGVWNVHIKGLGVANVKASSGKEAVKNATKALGRKWFDVPASRVEHLRFLGNKPDQKLFVAKIGEETDLEEQSLTEIYTEGVMTLANGGQVNIDKPTAEKLNTLYQSLNAANRKKMEEAIAQDEEAFERIKAFAKGEEIKDEEK